MISTSIKAALTAGCLAMAVPAAPDLALIGQYQRVCYGKWRRRTPRLVGFFKRERGRKKG